MKNNFGEKNEEYSKKQGKNIPVWQTPKYEESKAKALEIIDRYEDITAGDFWILMNESRNGKMLYSGLIISHNGCLKLNEHLSPEMKFRPECVHHDKDGYGDSLVFYYACPDQGLFEVGEVSKTNCKNDYPYAMAFKRLYDRVILKNTKLAFAGIYSDSESDEFVQRQDYGAEKTAPSQLESKTGMEKVDNIQVKTILNSLVDTGSDVDAFLSYFNVAKLDDLNRDQYVEAMRMIEKKAKKNA